MFAQIALGVPLRRLFDYKIPTHFNVKVGCRVEVPFGRQLLVGLVIAIKDHTDFDAAKVKEIKRLLDITPIYNQQMLSTLAWLQSYYLCPPGEVFINLLPKKLKEGAPAELLSEPIWQVKESASEPSARAFKQLALYHFLKKTGATTQSLLLQDGFSHTVIKQLAEKKIIEEAPLPPICKSVAVERPEYSLNPEQIEALSQINTLSQFAVVLLEGVTGSGKTEVYMQAMQDVLARGEQVLILVPEIGLTPQTLQRFQSRFKCQISVLHSELNDSERHNAWLKAAIGISRIIIGTRSAVMVPAPDLGLIILDEEHDASYKQQDGLRYNARDVAIKRASAEACKIILGSATPSLESLLNAKQGKYLHLQMKKRAQAHPPPMPQLIDIKHQPLQAGLAYGVVQAIEHHLNKKQQVLVFLNRRGFSPALICHECGWVAECKRCDKHFTYHKNLQQVVCHHCGAFDRPPAQCAECGSSQIVDWGVGTEQLADWLESRFPEANAIRIDRDSVRRKGALENKLAAIQKGEHQLLIGTQMLAKGHHFPNLTLTVVVNLDSALYSTDFRAVEKMAQLLVQVAGRAGRADKPGQVILQTHFPEHPYLQTLIGKGYSELQDLLLTERQASLLPPYRFWCLVRMECQHSEKLLACIEQTEALFNQQISVHYQGVELFASMPAPQEKRAGRFRYLMIFSAKQRSMLNAAMRQLVLSLEQNKFAQAVRWSIDIDPQELN
ncbi:primosomal protein N' [Catenovulum sediminis]|uniref:Replication restart protein PriA n=1 Tax=Catenovulum sediminis TaxID=1740262 RepID=A0ABV1REM9_9ALTE|nr:primosomal protein N' [Catenovulum sediminis]